MSVIINSQEAAGTSSHVRAGVDAGGQIVKKP